ncbi:MAG: GTP cyclohydrolase I FolE [Ruminococcus sp.]|jgi:GTP cyclohydrolase I|nr:GTP cyclohydrolase I FolE [Ruminococcus sp.]
MDLEKIQYHIKGLLEAIGEDPEREGLIDTPIRVARMYEELLEGTKYSNEEIAQMYSKTFSAPVSDGIIIVRDIEVFSFCEHHLALMYDMSVTVAYLPGERIIGLSKIARIAETAAHRLQVQERLTADIAEIVSLAVKSEDIAVFISGKHSCMTARGIKNGSSVTETSVLRGKFSADESIRRRLFEELNFGKRGQSI